MTKLVIIVLKKKKIEGYDKEGRRQIDKRKYARVVMESSAIHSYEKKGEGRGEKAMTGEKY